MTQTEPSHAESLDLEMFKGCHAYTAQDDSLNHWNIAAGDRVIVDPNLKVTPDTDMVAVMFEGDDLPRFRKRWRNGKLFYSHGVDDPFDGVPFRILGVVRGVVRCF